MRRNRLIFCILPILNIALSQRCQEDAPLGCQIDPAKFAVGPSRQNIFLFAIAGTEQWEADAGALSVAKDAVVAVGDADDVATRAGRAFGEIGGCRISVRWLGDWGGGVESCGSRSQ